MANYLLTLCLCICAVGKANAAISTGDSTSLTITYDGESVIYVCTNTAQTLTVLTDLWALTKDGATAAFQTSAAAGDTVVFSGSAVTKTVLKADFTAADYGSYTCAVQSQGAAAISATSPAVAFTALGCSSAPCTVDSLALALVCVLASVVKTKLY